MKIFGIFCILTAFLALQSQCQELFFDIENAPAPLFRCPVYDGAADPTVMWNKERNEIVGEGESALCGRTSERILTVRRLSVLRNVGVRPFPVRGEDAPSRSG